MAKKRRYQQSSFTGLPNKNPEFRQPGQQIVQHAAAGSAYTKRASNISIPEAWKAFDDGLKKVLQLRILGARLQEGDVIPLKRELEQSKRVLNDVYKHGTEIHKLYSSAIQVKLRNADTVNHQKEYIQANFDNIAAEAESFPTAKQKPKKDMPGAPAGRKQETATRPFLDFRTVTTTYSSIIRKDRITAEMSRHFEEMFNAATEHVSNHIVDYAVQILKYITIFKTHTFNVVNRQVVLEQTQAPFRLTDILPTKYLDESTLQRPLPPPLMRNFLNNNEFQEPSRNFLNEQHLDRIYSTYFGRMPSEATLGRYRLHSAVLTALPRPTVVPREAFSHAKIVARNTFKTNFENLWNLKRRFTNVFNKLITILLRLHLAPEREAKYQEYLKTKRQGQDDDTPTPEQATNGTITFAGKSRNQIRRIFSQERRNQQKYTNKAKTSGGNWYQKAKRSADRLTTFTVARFNEKQQAASARATATSVGDNTEPELEFLSQTNPAASSQLDEIQDSQQDTNRDLNARELRELAAFIRTVIFKYPGQQTPVTEKQFQDTDKSISGERLAVCLNIVNRLLPYVPSRQNWFSKLHQLPFILLANEIFRATGYARFATKLTNLPSTGTLMGLQLDVASIYSTFCVQQGNRRMLNLFTYDEQIIANNQTALSNQDAIFNSIFDLNKIRDILGHQLQFRHNVTLLPGLKTVRIFGTKKEYALTGQHPALPLQQKPQLASSKPPPAAKEPTLAEKKKIEQQITIQKAEVNALQRQLRDTMKDQAAFLTNEYPAIKRHKAGFLNKHQDGQIVLFSLTERATRNEAYQVIQQLKNRRDGFHQEITRIKRDLARQRMILHRLRKGQSIEAPESESVQTTPTIQITEDSYTCYEKAENVRLDPTLHDSPNMRFSGTDNGIVTMTETSRFDMQRFRFHLKLANKFEALKGLSEAEADARYTQDIQEVLQELKGNPGLLEIPKSYKMHATDIDFKTGAKKQRARLYRAKQSTEGQAVLRAEAILSQNSLHDAQDLDQIDNRYRQQLAQRQTIRQFYHTQTKAKQRRYYEYTKRKQIDILCSQERKYIKSEDGEYIKKRDRHNQSILFIGDRGTGVGSRIKGHLRYGGHWKSNNHSLYTSVCITNEFNTSQACAFCFEKITHPVKMVNGKLKTINGTSVCSNSKCLLVINKRSHQPRDSQSALLIGLSGLCTILSARTTYPALNPKNQNISQSDTDFQTFASTFLQTKHT